MSLRVCFTSNKVGGAGQTVGEATDQLRACRQILDGLRQQVS